MPDRARGAVARQADHPHVVAEVLASELRSDPRATRQLENLSLELVVPEATSQLVARLRQRVEVLRRGELGHLHRVLGRRAADHDGEMVGRASSGPERADLLPRKAMRLVGFRSAFVSW